MDRRLPAAPSGCSPVSRGEEPSAAPTTHDSNRGLIITAGVLASVSAALSTLPLALICQMAMYRNVDEHMRNYTRASEAMSAALVEFVHAIPVVKVFNAESRSLTALFQSIEGYRRLLIRIAQKVVPSWSLFKLVMRSTILVVAVVGALRFQSGHLTMVDLVLCLMVGAGLLQPVMRLLFAGSLLRMIEHGALRVREILEGPELPQPLAAKVPADASVAFEGVSFSYGSTPALHNVTFRVPAGRTVALVGRSGAGKSTVARLVARFWDPAEGAVQIGGVDLRDVPSENLGQWVSFVFQNVFLFDDTVRENIRLGLAAIVTVPLGGMIMRAFRSYFVALHRDRAAQIGEVGGRLLEFVQGIRVIRAFGLSAERHGQLDESLKRLRSISIRLETFGSLAFYSFVIVLEAGFLLVVFLGAKGVTTGSVAAPAFLMAMLLCQRLYTYLTDATSSFAMVSYMGQGVSRIRTVMETRPLPVASSPLSRKATRRASAKVECPSRVANVNVCRSPVQS